MVLLQLLACGTHCDVTGPLDYSLDNHWLCRPDVAGACPSTQSVLVASDNETWERVEREYTSDTGVACFVVYPTLDLRLGAGMHHDVDFVPGPKDWARDQAAALGQACDLWIPVYRQVLIGTYAGKETEKKTLCLNNAYQDVAAAFDIFLEANPDRPIALFGHSQGSQHLSRLMRERFDDNRDLRDRLVGAYLLGWALGTNTDELTGGSFENIPVCNDTTTPGCVMGFGTFFDGNPVPDRGRFEEGTDRVCVNPAAPGVEGPALMSALTVPSTTELVVVPAGVEREAGVLFEFPEALYGECVGDESAALQLTVNWQGFKYNEQLLSGSLGAHNIDVMVGMTDIVNDLRQRAATMGAR